MATYAIGDIQGCYSALQCLLAKIGFNAHHDTLWIAGDLVNRGPQSLATLRYLYSLGDSVIVVLGNHDLHLLALAHDVRTPNKSDTINDILDAPDRHQLLAWLQQQKLIHSDPVLNFTMVHAGIPPNWTVPQAIRYANEVEQILQSPQANEYFEEMYGNHPNSWDEQLKGPSRWRLITNYLTRMRYCTKDGELDLISKDTQAPADTAYQPWFSHSARLAKSSKSIFGHWAALQGESNTSNVYALDTGCVWGGQLSALRLEDQQYFRCRCTN